MKTNSVFAILFALLATAAAAQIPQQVESVFNSKYPNATVVKYKHRHNTYIATFTNYGKTCKATFNPTGKWISTDIAMKTDMIPLAVKMGLKNSRYNGWYVEDVNCIEKPGSKLYALSVDRSTTFIGLGGYQNIYFTPSGTIVK